VKKPAAASNIPEISPFIFFIIFSIPLPLSTVLILCIDLGTDMVPAISFAYENPELDIMERYPRNSKRDHLVNTKLISFAYLQIGVIQASAGMYTYFLILNDYGIRPSTLWDLSEKKSFLPKVTDVWNADQTSPVTLQNSDISILGNSNAGKEDSELVKLAWDKTKMSKVDIRLFYGVNKGADGQSIRGPDAWTQCRWAETDTCIKAGNCKDANGNITTNYSPEFYRKSYTSEWHPVCYSTEALKYAQSGYLVSIVIVQWADLMICKTRNLSLSQQGMKNTMGNFGLFFETALVMILCYAPPLNVALGTRAIAFPHFGAPSFSFYCAIFFYDELRKIWLRNGMEREGGKLKLKGWIVQNTYY
jgi:sodium/potassium-transporting ATPase subunit alpha